MYNQRGFIGLPVLIAILLGIVVLGGGAYYVVQQQTPRQTTSENFDNVQTLPTTNNQTQETQTTVNTPAQTSQNTTNTKPAITVTAWHSDGPATISVSYSNLPKKTSALALCVDNGACTDWVENFTPPSPSGTYTMSVQHGYAESQKGLGAGKYKIVVIGSEFSDQIVASSIFTVSAIQSSQSTSIIPDIIRITSPNGGETLKIGDTVRVSWDAKNVPGKYVGLRLEVWQISGDKPIIDATGQCSNCIEGGMITLSNPVSSDGLANGAGSVDWVVGKKLYPLHTPPGPGNNYVLLAVAERGNTDEEAAECRQKNPNSVMCGKPWTVELGRDYSDRVFSITN